MKVTSLRTARPRVGIDAHVLDGKKQGSATFLVGILRSLAKLELPFDVVVYSADPECAAAKIGPNSFTWSRLRPTSSFRRLMEVIPLQFAEEGIDLGLFQFVAPPFARFRTMIVVHDVLPFTHPDLFPLGFRISRQILFRQSISRASSIATVSNTAMSEILRLFDRPAKSIFVTPNGPSFERATYFAPPPARPATISPNRPYILAVGRIEKRKNIDLLVRAFRKAELANVDLIIVGRADLDCRPDWGGQSSVIHLEGVEDAELAALHRHAGLFCFPSRAEGFGIPLLDALLSGAPAIASNQTAIPEVANGLARLFDPTAADAEDTLALMLREHFSDAPIAAPTEEERLALAQRFNWDASATVFAQAIVHALGRGDNL